MTTGFRTYEVYQRERVGRSTRPIRPRQLMSDEFRRNPYPVLGVLREQDPCYRDWIGNSFWITRYDDVTSVLMDGANYETRSRAWVAGLDGLGRDLSDELDVLRAEATRIDAALERLATEVATDIAAAGRADLAVDLAGRTTIRLLAEVLDLPASDVGAFARAYWTMHRGVTWQPHAHVAARAAAEQLVAMLAPLVERRRSAPGEDVVSAAAGLGARAEDVVATLLERDTETLQGALATTWFLLLTHPDQLEEVRSDRRLVRFAYLEAVRHSAPVLHGIRYARHEVERFGRLLPEGALMVCSAAAANRDPRAFDDPDRFDVRRRDLCQREPRGTYRADGLPSGVTPGLGLPSRHPAVPEDRPRSRAALVRDVVVAVSSALLEATSDIRVAPGAAPELSSLRLGDVHTCWQLPVDVTPA